MQYTEGSPKRPRKTWSKLSGQFALSIPQIEQIKRAFCAVYSSDALIGAFKAHLHSIDRKAGENLAVYVGELPRLATRA